MNGRDGVEMRRRVRVERGVYGQPNGKYAVCFMLDGKPRLRTVEGDLDAARSAHARLAIAAQAGLLPACSRLTFTTGGGALAGALRDGGAYRAPSAAVRVALSGGSRRTCPGWGRGDRRRPGRADRSG